MQLYADGWMDKELAEECLADIEQRGGLPVGLIESKYGAWGFLYWSAKTLFENHVIDWEDEGHPLVRPALRRMALR